MVENEIKAEKGRQWTSENKQRNACIATKKKRNDTGILKQEKTSGSKIIVAKLTE